MGVIRDSVDLCVFCIHVQTDQWTIISRNIWNVVLQTEGWEREPWQNRCEINFVNNWFNIYAGLKSSSSTIRPHMGRLWRRRKHFLPTSFRTPRLLRPSSLSVVIQLYPWHSTAHAWLTLRHNKWNGIHTLYSKYNTKVGLCCLKEQAVWMKWMVKHLYLYCLPYRTMSNTPPPRSSRDLSLNTTPPQVKRPLTKYNTP